MRCHSVITLSTRRIIFSTVTSLSLLLVMRLPALAYDPPTQTAQADFDEDGVDDHVVAEPDQSGNEPGSVEVYSGETGETLGTLSGSESGDQFGYSISASCDVNGDGVRDLIVGAPKAANGEGRAYVFHGPIRDEENLTPEDADLTLQSPDQDTYDFGKRVECLEDLDEDGKPDILVEAFYTDESQNEVTRTYIVSGVTGALIERLGKAEAVQIPVWNVDDLLMVINAWGTPNGDITGDDLTNVNDLLYVINHWGQNKFPFAVNPPVNPTTIPLTNGYLLLDNITDGVRLDTTIVGQQFGMLTNNGQTSTRIHTRGSNLCSRGNTGATAFQ